MKHTIEQIARVVHEANRAMQYNQNDPCPSQPWDVETPELRERTINGVRLIRLGHSNTEMHDAWCQALKEDGWEWGPIKNAAAKRHPCLVTYGDLPDNEKHKTELIRVIVTVLSST
jgi:hypothetical protein